MTIYINAMTDSTSCFYL